MEYNRSSLARGHGVKAAYTFDAGPNAVIYAPEQNMREIISLIHYYFPQSVPFDDPFRLFSEAPGTSVLPEGFNLAVAKKAEVGSISRLIHTRVGDGPRVLDDSEALLNVSGLPFT